MILRWDKPAKVMTADQWKAISADGAPAGVYTPNMSDDDNRAWKARYIGGKDPRVEIRKFAVGTVDRRKPGDHFARINSAQVLIIVDCESVRMSMNGTAEWGITEFSEMSLAVEEAKLALELAERRQDGQQ